MEKKEFKKKLDGCTKRKEVINLYYEEARERINAVLEGQNPQEYLEQLMHPYERIGLTPKQLNEYLGERGVIYILDILCDFITKKDTVDTIMLVEVIEHLVVSLVNRDKNISKI